MFKPSLKMVVIGLLATTSIGGMAADSGHPPYVEEMLVAPPNVPAPITRTAPATVIVRLTIQEKEVEIASGVRYKEWTFNGSVPGPMMRVREGDWVELHLVNPAGSTMTHNIDLHAVMGPGGGAAVTETPPGHESILRFKATTPGIFVYHCATPPVPMHIANGMYGMILVEPASGLAKVDHEYYVMQGDFYLSGKGQEPGMHTIDMTKLIDEQPNYVLFNGAEGSLTGSNALTSKVGDSVRLFFGVGGPNLTSSFHIIGQIMDDVNVEGGDLINHHVQTTLVPPGGGTMIKLTTRVPGTYLLVDHAITRAFMKGALGQLVVSGPEQPDLYQAMTPKFSPPAPAPNVSDAMAVGKRVFGQICSACHQGDGMGLPGAFPPLAMSDFLNSDHKRAIGIVLHGLSGQVVVNKTGYESQMPPFGGQLNDQEISGVLTYVLNNFNNQGGTVSVDEVKTARAAKGS